MVARSPRSRQAGAAARGWRPPAHRRRARRRDRALTNVLIVEDDTDIGSVLSRGLAARASTSRWRIGAEAPSRRPGRAPPGAIVLDIILPDGSGHDVCRSLREGGYHGPDPLPQRQGRGQRPGRRPDASGPTTTSSSRSSSTNWWRACARICCSGPEAPRTERRVCRRPPGARPRDAGRPISARDHRRLTQREAELLAAADAERQPAGVARRHLRPALGDPGRRLPQRRRRLCRLSAHQVRRYHPRRAARSSSPCAAAASCSTWRATPPSQP